MTSAVLVVGYGSIGARHARLLVERGCAVACVTRNAECPHPRFGSIAEAVRGGAPQAVVIANATADHAASLAALNASGYRGRVLVEKPLTGGGKPPEETGGMSVFVAYNLRFHPLLVELKRRLDGLRLLNAAFHVGQYLPDWRPGADYRLGYSARRAGGGGALRDLSHEIDLAGWICGGWKRVSAIVGRLSSLEIETDDTAMLLVESERCPAVAISLNYLDRMPRRMASINAERSGEVVSAQLDLVAGRLTIGGETLEARPERDATYREQLAAFLEGRDELLCDLESAAGIDALIAAAEIASRDGSWVASQDAR